MKITNKIQKALDNEQKFFSFEYFPPKTDQGVVNLYERIERMTRLNPLFAAVTWGAGGATAERTLEICSLCQGIYGLESLMHLTCTNMDQAMIDSALKSAKDSGIQNILALRGDAPHGDEFWTPTDNKFVHAVDLVRYIRQQYGDYFCIGVAGYPEGHTENPDKDQDFKYLQEKVDAGADFIITQLFYDVPKFLEWYRKCRGEGGIDVPIIPGIMPIQNYQSFRRLTFLTKVEVPGSLLESLDPIKSDDKAVKDFGVEYAVKMIREIFDSGIDGVHITTLNLESTARRVLLELGLSDSSISRPQVVLDKGSGLLSSAAATPGSLIPAGIGAGGGSNKVSTEIAPGSLLSGRTHLGEGTWDEFPNGRWGDARSPAFGQIDGYGVSIKQPPGEALRLWGAPRSADDISKLFSRYVIGDLSAIPWNDEPLFAESQKIRDQLVRINESGFWTLASQPAIDGIRSEDKVCGWGPHGGYVYQKAFVECFVSPDKFPAFLSKLQTLSSEVTYYAANNQGDFMTNSLESSEDEYSTTTALTWGVFPGQSIVQSTLIDKMNFLAWRDEAFQIWEEWSGLYPKNSKERKFLKEVSETYWLVNAIGNDYKNPDFIFQLF
ncbi:methylenetetrahydrofolate reductase 1 [Mycoemilia scoparia]|uniref:Methylenetetrahydrofolate reductase 1 n=1 Tax=Mycoemilia scoparia TaxID=417184 RepID=A0A9W8A0S9_9FUNG|nr:methylenetetrahydrofolate reductase 1 [Mycoemilia scoparia]